MKNFLEELYWLHQEEHPYRHSGNKALQRATDTFSTCEDILTKRLDGENLEWFNKSIDAADEMTAHTAIDNFVNGTKVGAKLMMEILTTKL